MASHGTVLSTLPKGMLRHLGSLGHDEEALAREAGIDRAAIADDDSRVGRETVDALFDAAVRVTGDGAYGVKLAFELPPGNTGIFEIVVSSARSVGEAFGHVARYWHILNDGVDLRVVRTPAEIALVLETRSAKPLARPWLDLTVVSLVVLGARMLERPRPPRRIGMPYRRDRFSPELEAMLPGPVTYETRALEIAFDAGVAMEPLASANSAVQRVAVGLAEELLAVRSKEATPEAELEDAVRRAIVARLEHGDANLSAVAKDLGVSSRTLQRRLGAAKTSLRELVDQARHEIALRELGARKRSVTDVAFLLGFSETSAFDRAFRRWTGTSPVEYRRRADASSRAESESPPPR